MISGATRIVGHSYYGIYAYEGSAINFLHPSGVPAAVITNNGVGISCGDQESSLVGDISGVIGNPGGNVNNCSGF